jgi:hypothetical protein
VAYATKYLIFFSLQAKPSFCHMFALSQLDFSAIPVSISAVSLTGRQTWQNVNSKRRCKEFKREKTSEKRNI